MDNQELGIPKGFVTGVHEPSQNAAAYDEKCAEWTQVCNQLRAASDRDVRTAADDHQRQQTSATLQRLQNAQSNHDALNRDMKSMEVQLDLLINLDDYGIFVEKFTTYKDILKRRTSARAPSQLPKLAGRTANAPNAQKTAQKTAQPTAKPSALPIFNARHEQARMTLMNTIHLVDSRSKLLPAQQSSTRLPVSRQASARLVAGPSQAQSPARQPSRAQTPARQASRQATPSRQASRQATPSRQASRQATPSRQASRQATPSRQPSRAQTPARPASTQATPCRQPSRAQTPARQASRQATPSRQPSRQQIPVRQASKGQIPVRQPSRAGTPVRQVQQAAATTPSRQASRAGIPVRQAQQQVAATPSRQALQAAARQPAQAAGTSRQPARAASTAKQPARAASAAKQPARAASAAKQPARAASAAKQPARAAGAASRSRQQQAAARPAAAPAAADPAAAARRVREIGPRERPRPLDELNRKVRTPRRDPAAENRLFQDDQDWLVQFRARRAQNVEQHKALRDAHGDWQARHQLRRQQAFDEDDVESPPVVAAVAQPSAGVGAARQLFPASAATTRQPNTSASAARKPSSGAVSTAPQSQWLRFYDEICNEVETINKALLETYGTDNDQPNYNACQQKIANFINDRKKNRNAIIAAIRANNEDATAKLVYKALRPLEQQTFLCNDITDANNLALVLRIKELPKRVSDTIDTMRWLETSGREGAATTSGGAKRSQSGRVAAARSASSTSILSASQKSAKAGGVRATSSANRSGTTLGSVAAEAAPLEGGAVGGVSTELERLVNRTMDEFNNLLRDPEGLAIRLKTPERSANNPPEGGGIDAATIAVAQALNASVGGQRNAIYMMPQILLDNCSPWQEDVVTNNLPPLVSRAQMKAIYTVALRKIGSQLLSANVPMPDDSFATKVLNRAIKHPNDIADSPLVTTILYEKNPVTDRESFAELRGTLAGDPFPFGYFIALGERLEHSNNVDASSVAQVLEEFMDAEMWPLITKLCENDKLCIN